MTTAQIITSPLQFTDLPEELKQVHKAWVEAKGSAIGPSLKTFDLFFIPLAHIPFSSITDYFAERDEFIVRFFGTGLVSIDGCEMTGKNLLETPHSGLRKTLEILFRKVVDEKCENFSEIQYDSTIGPQRLSISGRWPLSEDGKNVTGVLSVIYPLKDTQNLHEIIGSP